MEFNDILNSNKKYKLTYFFNAESTITISIEEESRSIINKLAHIYRGLPDNTYIDITNEYKDKVILPNLNNEYITTFIIYGQGNYRFKNVEYNQNSDEFEFYIYYLDDIYGSEKFISIKNATRVLLYLAKTHSNAIYFPEHYYEPEIKEYISIRNTSISTMNFEPYKPIPLSNNDDSFFTKLIDWKED